MNVNPNRALTVTIHDENDMNTVLHAVARAIGAGLNFDDVRINFPARLTNTVFETAQSINLPAIIGTDPLDGVDIYNREVWPDITVRNLVNTKYYDFYNEIPTADDDEKQTNIIWYAVHEDNVDVADELDSIYQLPVLYSSYYADINAWKLNYRDHFINVNLFCDYAPITETIHAQYRNNIHESNYYDVYWHNESDTTLPNGVMYLDHLPKNEYTENELTGYMIGIGL